MGKAVFRLSCFLVPFLILFSVIRKANGQTFLDLNSFMSYVNSFNWDFSTVQASVTEWYSLLSNVFIDPSITSIMDFFQWFSSFINFLIYPIQFVLALILDLLETIVNVFRILGLLFGITVTA